MASVVHVPTDQRPRSSGWFVLVVGTLVMFVLGAAVQILVFLLFGLCMESAPPGR